MHPHSINDQCFRDICRRRRVSGPATVIEAMAAGRKAAVSIDQYLRGERLEGEEPLPRTIGLEDVDSRQIQQARAAEDGSSAHGRESQRF